MLLSFGCFFPPSPPLVVSTEEGRGVEEGKEDGAECVQSAIHIPSEVIL